MATTPVPETVAAARAAGLRHVSDTQPGLRRRRDGESFAYFDAAGERIADEEILARIKSLVIPPAWTDVWICALDRGHIQATGRDAKGRKQYRYHPRWREVRDEDKYGRMAAFARALPRIRRRIDRDLRRRGLPREKVLATVVRLLETSMIRVGNEEYARENRSFGLTTMRDRHVKVGRSDVRFYFRGKSGVEHRVTVRDRRLARVVGQCQELPGQEIFQYVEDGQRRSVDSADVNEYIREASGGDFTAKDFRTWAGTVLAAQALAELREFDSEAQAKRNVVQAIESVARQLGNTRTVCRQCYVHPAILDAYMDGVMIETLQQKAEETIRNDVRHMRPEEAAVLGLLQQRLKRESRSRTRAA